MDKLKNKIILIDNRVEFDVTAWCLKLRQEQTKYFEGIRQDRIENGREEFLSKTTPAGIDEKWEEFKNKMNQALQYFEKMEIEFNNSEVERSRKIQGK